MAVLTFKNSDANSWTGSTATDWSTTRSNIHLRTVLDQPYDLIPFIVTKGLQQYYIIAGTTVLQSLAQIYSLRMVSSFIQRYGDSEVTLQILRQYYDDASQLLALLEQRYEDATAVRATLEQPYEYPAFLLTVLKQRYSLSGHLLLKVCNQLYNIRGVDLAATFLLQPFSLLDDTTSVITPDPGDGVIVTPPPASGGGDSPPSMSIGYSHINIEAGSDQYCMSCEVHLASQEHYIQINVLDDLTITIDGQDFEFFVESKQRRRGHGTAEYTVQGLSKTALLDAPYTEDIEETELIGMASVIVESLASGYTVNWNTVDWHIPANTLLPSDQTPLSVIRDIVAAAGAIIQTEPNGEITIEPLWPIPIPDWPTNTPVYVLSDALDFFTTGENYEHKPGYNRYLIENEDTSDNTIRFEEETLSETTKHVRVYQVPWTGIFDITHTGCSWVILSDEGVEERIVEDEMVEFIDGVGTTQYPIYGLISYGPQQDSPIEKQCAPLGDPLEYEEDGTLTFSIVYERLLKISYLTKCKRYLVTDPKEEQVQIIAEEI